LRFPGVPLSARLPKSAQSPSGEVDFDELRPATLLVVDDNDLNRELIAGMFAGTQHRLFFGSSGPEAIVRAGEFRPDVMLLDVRMPGMDGCQALKEIRKLPGLEMVPSIAMSASAPPNERNGSEISFDGFVRKPFSKRELFEALAEFLPRRDASGISPGPEGAAPTANFEPAAPELLAELHRLMAGQWAALRDTLAINECKDFAQTLAAAGKRWDCDPLNGYARKLYQDADSYDAAELEKNSPCWSNNWTTRPRYDANHERQRASCPGTGDRGRYGPRCQPAGAGLVSRARARIAHGRDQAAVGADPGGG
jgi:CheY-like chemotaxis protein